MIPNLKFHIQPSMRVGPKYFHTYQVTKFISHAFLLRELLDYLFLFVFIFVSQKKTDKTKTRHENKRSNRQQR
jgi:hypothetical protein